MVHFHSPVPSKDGRLDSLLFSLQETRKIKQAGLPLEKEQEVLQQLLHKETKLLQTIDRLKINANQENKDMRVQRTLAEMGKPKRFELKDGKTVEVHTPFTTRAMELMQLYNGLNLAMLTIDERLDVLLHVKWTVKEFDCKLTREIVDLIEREADMLNRSVERVKRSRGGWMPCGGHVNDFFMMSLFN